MDALSHILEDIPISQAEYVYVSGRGNWLVEQPQQSAMITYAVTAGEAYLYLHDQTIKLQAGGILLMPSGIRHQIGIPDSRHSLLNPYFQSPATLTFGSHDNPLQHIGEGNTQAVVLAVRCLIDEEMSRPILSALPDCFLLHGDENQSMPAWLQLGLQFLGLETERNRPGRDTLLNRLAYMFFVECVRDYVEQLPEESESWLTALRDPSLMTALSAIHNQPAHPWTVADLASIACMSRSSFAERFTEIIGQPPLSYLSAHRLRTATKHLTQNYESIARISERVGYSSEAAFSQAFKRQYDMSPSQYRKENKMKGQK